MKEISPGKFVFDVNDYKLEWDLNLTKEVDFTCKTSGTSIWGEGKGTSRNVRIVKIELQAFNSEFGELRAYFDPKTWALKFDQKKGRFYGDGLIYTDMPWLERFKEQIGNLGFNSSEISYSEQGMQGEDYVSMDVEKPFMDSFISSFLKTAES